MFDRIVANLSGDYRRAELEGRPHLVVPCVMLVEGVINGSQGPLLYPKEENGKDPSAWDHMPVVVYHPEQDGKFVSARTPTWLNARKVGVVLNTRHDDKLKTEAWFDEERTKEVDLRVYQAIIDRKQVEVSTGLGLDVETKAGVHNGVEYKGIARNHRPDHLAILPDQVGACSIKQGAGLFANAAKEPESAQLVFARSVERTLRLVGVDLASNVLSFSQTSRMLSDALAGKYGEKGKYWDGWITEVYPSSVIFCSPDGKCWAQKYAATETSVTLSGEAVEVIRTMQYVSKDGKTFAMNSAGEFLEPQVETSVPVPVPPKESSMPLDKKKHVTGLIGNGFEESDRAWLEALPDAQLEKILPAAKVPDPVVPVQTPPVVPAANAAAVQPQLTLDQLVANADPATQAAFADMKASHEREKKILVEKVKSAPNNQFPEQVLANMALPNLRAIAALIPDQQAQIPGGFYDLNTAIPGVGGAYAGAAGAITSNATLDEPPLPPEMTFNSPDKNSV